MKALKVFLFLLALGSLTFSLTSCKNKDASVGTEQSYEDGEASSRGASTDPRADETRGDADPTADGNVDTSGPEYTSDYVCPMHCKGSGSKEAGKCPACGMDYVANTDHRGDGHDHEGEDPGRDGGDGEADPGTEDEPQRESEDG